MHNESFTRLRERAKAVDGALKLKYEKHRATAPLGHQNVMDSSRKDVVRRVDATAKFLQEAEIMGLSLEAAISCKEEVLILWDMLENADSQNETLLKRLATVEKQLGDLFQEREILISRLIARNITNKLARRTIPHLNEAKKAIGYNFDNIKASKKTDMVLFNDYTTRYPDLETGLKFLFNAGLQVPHPKQLVNKDGTELVLTETVLANCLKGAYGDNHPEYLGMESALKLLKDLSLDLKEDLIVNTW